MTRMRPTEVKGFKGFAVLYLLRLRAKHGIDRATIGHV